MTEVLTGTRDGYVLDLSDDQAFDLTMSVAAGQLKILNCGGYRTDKCDVRSRRRRS